MSETATKPISGRGAAAPATASGTPRRREDWLHLCNGLDPAATAAWCRASWA